MEREFKIVKKYLNSQINIPVRQTINSAGYDFEAASDYVINPMDIVLVSTGIKVYLKEEEVLFLVSRSSLPKKMGLMIPNGFGVIDADYVDNDDNEGEIFVQFLNFSNKDVVIKKGDRIAQGIITKYLKTISDSPKQVKRIGGFGSSN
jgi:dUTP pyrophosphatase